jgi:hypothetical protein
MALMARSAPGRPSGVCALEVGGDDVNGLGITSLNNFETRCEMPDMKLALKVGTAKGGRLLALL